MTRNITKFYHKYITEYHDFQKDAKSDKALTELLSVTLNKNDNICIIGSWVKIKKAPF